MTLHTLHATMHTAPLRRHALRLCLALVAALTLSACSENLTSDADQYKDWKARNAAYFRQQLTAAEAAVASAKALYGDAWEAHCNYRLLRVFSMTDDGRATADDSIVVEVLQAGTGSGCPLYTDSVRVCYLGRLIPTETHPEGKVFDHSGLTVYESDIFSPDAAVQMFAVSKVVMGWTTALMHMHIGDRWRITIPPSLAYGSSALKSVPAWSVLNFDVELRAYYRAGTTPGKWQ